MSNAYWALFEVCKEIVEWGFSTFPNGLPIKPLRQRYAECQPLADRLMIAADLATFETAPTGTSRNENVASVGELQSHCQDLISFRPAPDQNTSEERISQIIVAANRALQHVRILARSLDRDAGEASSAKAQPPPPAAAKASKGDLLRWEFAKPLREKDDAVSWKEIAELWQKETGEPVDEISMKQACYRARKAVAT